MKMKKTYIAPKAKGIELQFEGLIAESLQGGLGDGDYVGNQKPTGDDDDNFMSNRRGIWGDTEW